MAFRYREEIVGKRFLSVSGSGKLKLAKICEWEWRAGVVRAASHKDPKHSELTILVEFDDVEWKRREWIRVYEENIFQAFLVENTLTWAPRKDPHSSKHGNVPWPALNYKFLVDKIGLKEYHLKPVEYLVDKAVNYLDYITLKNYQEGEDVISPAQNYADVKKAIKQWIEYQDGQRILLSTPSVLVGERVEVYRVEGTTQWYTAVIGSYNENTRELAVTDDTVLEEHNEDPCLVQMRVIGDGVIESILRGENTGITPRRRTCTLNSQNLGHYIRTRPQNQSPSHSTRFPNQVSCKKPRTKPSDSSSNISSPAELEKEKIERVPIARERKRKTSVNESTSPTSGDQKKVNEKILGKKSRAEDLRHLQTVESESSSEFDEKNCKKPAPSKQHQKISDSKEKEIINNQLVLEKDSPESQGEKSDDSEKRIISDNNSSSPVNLLHSAKERQTKKTKVLTQDQTVCKPLGEKNNKSNSIIETTVEDSSANLKSLSPKELISDKQDINRSVTEDKVSSLKDYHDKVNVSTDSNVLSSDIIHLDTKSNKQTSLSDRTLETKLIEKLVVSDNSTKTSDECCASRSSESSRLSNEKSASCLSACDNSNPIIIEEKARQLEELSKQSSKEHTSNKSPLVLHKSEPFNVWRDPKLVNCDNTVLHVQSVQHSLMAHPPNVTHGGSSVYSGVPVTSSLNATSSHPPPLTQHGRNAIAMSHYPQISTHPHVITSHSGATVAVANNPHVDQHGLHISGGAPGTVSSQQGYSHLLPQHPSSHLLPQYSGNIPVEMLWQQKYSPMPVNSPWMSMSYQEELAGRARLDRERRDLAERERLERDRHEREKEKERMEREKHEQEHLKRMKIEQNNLKQEQERAEREKREKHRAQIEAVHQHFEESLNRLATKKKSKLGWSPITSLPPKVGSNALEHNSLVTMASHIEISNDVDSKGNERVLVLEKKDTKDGQHSMYLVSDDEKCRSQENEKWLLGQQQQQQTHQSQKQTQLQQNSSYPYNEAVARPSSRSKVEYPPSTSHSYSYNNKCVQPPQTASPAHLPKAEPSFSLYGYQPFQHGYIIQDKLSSQGKPSGNIHDHKPSGVTNLSQSQMMSGTVSTSNNRRGSLPSPPPLLSTQDGLERKVIPTSNISSVIVSNETKSVSPHSISPKQQHRLIQNQEVNIYGSSGQNSGGMIAAGTAFKPYEYNHSPSPSQSPHSRGPISHHSPLPQQLDLSRNIQKSFVNSPHSHQTEIYASPTACLNSSVTSTTTGYTSGNVNVSSPSHFTTTTTNSHGHSTVKPVQTTYAHNLIQQGLVPNPIYSPSCTGSIGSSVSSAVVTSHSSLSKGCTQVNSVNSPNTSPLHLAYSKPGIMSGTPIPRMSSSPRSSHSPVIQHQTNPPAAHYNNKLTMDGGSRSTESHSPGRMMLDHPLQGMEHLSSSSGARGLSICNPTSRDSLAAMQSHVQPMCKSPSQISPVSGHHSHAPTSHLANVQYSGDPYSPSCPSSTSPSTVQMQPLNLQNPERLNPSPVSLTQLGKRKAPKDPVGRKRTKTNEGLHSVSVPQANPVLARVSAPSPLMVNAATTITTVMNTIAFPSGGTNESISTTSSISSTANVTVTTTSTVTTIANTAFGKNSPKMQSGFFDSYITFVNNSSSQKIDYQVYNKHKSKQKNSKAIPMGNSPVSPSPPPASTASQSGTTSPAAVSNPGSCTPSSNVSPEPDKSMSPTLSGSTNPVTKLKKAWLQRHSDEDTNRKDDFTPSNEASPSQIVNTSTSSNTVSSSIKHQDGTLESSNAAINGHNVDENSALVEDESTSSASEQEVEPVPPVKRLGRPAKTKTAKEAKRQKKNSENMGDSTSDEKQEIKGKEESVVVEPVKQPKKRGRKPKPKPEKEEPNKKSKSSGVVDEKPSIAKLRRTRESFLQNGPCCEVAPKLSKCRECRMTPNQRNKKMPNIFCRFYAFRRLKYTKHGFIASAGFSEPKDATEEEKKLWLPQPSNLPPDLDLETSKFLVSHVGNQFCDLVEQEKEAQNMHLADDDTVAWKRVVQGVREMCDVCETTLFNIHWACNKCGFVVCIDCYKARKNGTVKCAQNEEEIPGKDRDSCWWLLCNNRQPHEQNKLMLTQIIADQALWEMGKLVHAVRERWNIPMHCACIRQNMEKETKNQSTNGICKQLMSAVSQCFSEKKVEPVNGILDSNKANKKPGKSLNGTVSHLKQEEDSGNYNSSTASPLCWLADVALNSSGKLDSEPAVTNIEHKKEKEEIASESKEEHFSTLRELLIRPTTKSISNSNKSNNCIGNSLTVTKKQLNTLDDVINCMIEQSVNKQDDGCSPKQNKRLLHYMRRYPQPRSGWEPLPIRIFTLAESTLLFPDVNHSWLCEGRLLQLHDPTHEQNIHLFQEQWKRGQPVLVSGVNKALDMKLWHPEAFARDFGDIVNDLVNCHNGNIVQNHPMRKFWEGFENFSKRMKDETGEYMLLKLKDWPPGDDFSEMLPSRFKDLMKALPLPEYTHRNGKLNLAGRLPDCFVRPDLGPKMYNAYGSALYPSKGTTNLHLDISDAVNVMVYVGIPKDGNDEQHIQEALRAIDEAGCDILTRQRVREKRERPGALWHIYNARDADKIRDLLNKVALERGEKLEPHHDPIHDQSWYLDSALRERLYCEYGVEGYAIAQCLGDSVFIPAGAPHQVRNLHSCIKVAEDFVSPENVSHCFTLTQEFRDLSDTHTNHEDKLQVKNIIYHAVKDALSVMLAAEAKEAENKS